MAHNICIGSSFDGLLEEERILSEVSAITIKRVLVWQVSEAMSKQGLNKSQTVEQMKTSRTSLDRFLDTGNTSITLKTVERAATVLGKRLQIEIVDIEAHDAAMVK